MKYFNLLLLIMVTTHITLSWQHDAPQTVEHYRVEKSYTPDFHTVVMFATTKTTTYDDTPTTSALTYYRVIAVNDYGESDPSDVAQVLPWWPPRRPVGFKVFQYAR